MAKLGIDKDFLRDFGELERSVQERVTEVFAKFEDATHAGLHLEKLTHARDGRFRTIRIDKFWRGVVLAPETGDSYTLLKVLPHDDAYAWAARRRASVNAATGRFEISDVAAVEATMPELARMADRAPKRLFDGVGDADLVRLGLDVETLAFARVLTDVVQLEASRTFLPQNQWDALYGLAAGLTPEEVWAELGVAPGQEPYDTGDLTAAVERTPERVVLVEGPDELMEVFRHPFALWRIYLHPTQHQVAQATFSGSARVTGGPGTGKTVVALHRAHHLARLGAGPVLVTTFTSTLSASLEAGLRLLADSAGVRDLVEVRHVDQLSYQIFSERHGRAAILRDKEEKDIWRKIVKRLELPFTETFLAEEWRQVVLAQQVTNAAEYLAAKRAGRGRRLGTRQKAQLWQAIWEFEEELKRRKVWTYETICVEATRLLAERTEKPYRHVIVDEAQDLHPVQWRLLRAAVCESPDDMFIAGDTHQRIYNNRVSLREIGIKVAGRSARLTINYRTTAEILAWSLGMLRGEPIDDMDGSLDTVAGYRSQVHGLPPELRGFRVQKDELEALAGQVRQWLDAGVKPPEIGIAARSNMLADSVLTVLERAGIPGRSLAKAQDSDDAVRVGTMHRMKGLEFRCVAVVGVGEHQVPPANAITPVEEDELTHAHDLQRERCLLFVACTRPREQLYVSWHGAPSAFLSGFAG
ncbi:UvrD-helicase domain-containing protein [Planotetraspora kaengkrachanensis]|uniref:DNA 3'-5' helicase n=1 Tax=Planotetraspora kaengkrachanensis TaxID=575193 RepID=A0A8J3PTJ3_9ACTN|nr:UvrD-helicase domain-containing protein [Planotetraspora kaengkrachanensis]GIG80021.1 DNA helicase [Planotetraspora kaengkrachanensis]